jgi:hypothetical protein
MTQRIASRMPVRTGAARGHTSSSALAPGPVLCLEIGAGLYAIKTIYNVYAYDNRTASHVGALQYQLNTAYPDSIVWRVPSDPEFRASGPPGDTGLTARPDARQEQAADCGQATTACCDAQSAAAARVETPILA